MPRRLAIFLLALTLSGCAPVFVPPAKPPPQPNLHERLP